MKKELNIVAEEKHLGMESARAGVKNQPETVTAIMGQYNAREERKENFENQKKKVALAIEHKKEEEMKHVAIDASSQGVHAQPETVNAIMNDYTENHQKQVFGDKENN